MRGGAAGRDSPVEVWIDGEIEGLSGSRESAIFCVTVARDDGVNPNSRSRDSIGAASWLAFMYSCRVTYFVAPLVVRDLYVVDQFLRRL